MYIKSMSAAKLNKKKNSDYIRSMHIIASSHYPFAALNSVRKIEGFFTVKLQARQ